MYKCAVGSICRLEGWAWCFAAGTAELVESASELGRYTYMRDLRIMSQRMPVWPTPLPEKLTKVTTPLKACVWRSELADHPDGEFADYLLEGIQHGFRIGFNFAHYTCTSVKRNMLSAIQNPGVVEDYIAKECILGRIVGPLPEGLAKIQINRFGVIPKPHQPGKWRLIVDLSHPARNSVNDGIELQLCTLSYTSVDEAVTLILGKGRGTQLAKLDLESAYRIIPVHPDDRSLLGMEWKGSWYVDTVLPFGLRSAPKIFTAVADALMWIMAKHGVQSVIHYLDDYLFVGDPDSQECAEALGTALRMCEELGVPISAHKVEGPATTLTFLGILLDTVACEMRLPKEKLRRLKALIQCWRSKKSCSKRDLLSLIGHLQHAYRVVRPGRTFLRRMIELSTVAKELHHHIRLNSAFRSDLQWWAMFVSDWNGVSMMADVSKLNPGAVLTSDASGNWGCGGVQL